MSAEITVVDFSKYGMQVSDASKVDPQDLQQLGKSLYDALTTVGFCYISNHGLSDQLLNGFREASLEFFQQPADVKVKYRRGMFPRDTTGWIARETETLNPERPADIREAFNYEPHGDWKGFPDSSCSGFKNYCSEFFNTSIALTKRVLEVITFGMGLDADNEIIKSHQTIGQKNSHCEIRTSYHPPISTDLKQNQVRLGEHFDFGSLSLHFQDDVEGLEVCNRDGNYVPVKPVPGTALVLIGEVLQMWSSDKLIAPKHRVLAPTDEKSRSRAKQTFVSYLVPDSDTVIKCLDGSDKYKPCVFLDFVTKLMTDIAEKQE